MILYAIVIIIGMAAIAVTNIFGTGVRFDLSVTYCILATIIHTAAVIALDGLFAFLIRRLPEKLFRHEKKFFDVSLREKRNYEKLGIRKWKAKIPELGGFTKFSKSKIEKPHDNEYLDRYLLESCYGQVIHLVTVFTGFLIIFICPLRMWYCFGLPVAVVNGILNLLPLFTLRYNTYKLKILYRRNEKHART